MRKKPKKAKGKERLSEKKLILLELHYKVVFDTHFKGKMTRKDLHCTTCH